MIPLDGSPPTSFDAGPGGVYRVLADDKRIYWERINGGIMKVVK